MYDFGVIRCGGDVKRELAGTCRKEASEIQLEALGKDIANEIRQQAGGELPAFEGDW